jgi:hypothetical protein
MEKHLDLLGHRVKDAVTDFEGVVTGVIFELFGCVQATVTTTMKKDGEDKEVSRWFDVKRLTVLSGKRVMPRPVFEAPTYKENGGTHFANRVR